MKIGIINAGNIGRTLGQVWHDAGHDPLLAKAGDQETLMEFMPQVPQATQGTLKEAAKFGDTVLFSVYWPRFDETLDEVGDLNGHNVLEFAEYADCPGGLSTSGVRPLVRHQRAAAPAERTRCRD